MIACGIIMYDLFTAGDVLDKSARLLEEAIRALADPNNPDNQQRLAQVRPMTIYWNKL